jgi:leucyl aminopeptidase
MENYFTLDTDQEATALVCVNKEQYKHWLSSQDLCCANWVEHNQFVFKPGEFLQIPNNHGKLQSVLLCISGDDDFWAVGALAPSLPQGVYEIHCDSMSLMQLQHACLAWGLGHYQFTHYKEGKPNMPILKLPDGVDHDWLEHCLTSVYLVRDLINMPANDLGPTELAEQIKAVAKAHDAKTSIIVGEKLLKENYPAIHAVGKASTNPPQLVDLRWGDSSHPKITLVGKGVCFDSGGLDLKSASGMREMKKDMGGSAHALGLAQLIMAQKLPVNLRVLIPTVENSVAGNSYRPGDVIQTRAGLTVEIGNTDAEGRLILCDAIAEATAEKPDCLIDFATLTGAARVALGTDLPAFFSNDEAIAASLQQCATSVGDPIWRMPLYEPYDTLLKSDIADLNNISSSPYGGAITAALYLQRFVANETSWVHFDIMASNSRNLPGRPKGGEAMGLRACYEFIKRTYC